MGFPIIAVYRQFFDVTIAHAARLTGRSWSMPECSEMVACYDNWDYGNTEFEHYYGCGECGHRWRMVVAPDDTEPDTINHQDYEPTDD